MLNKLILTIRITYKLIYIKYFVFKNNLTNFSEENFSQKNFLKKIFWKILPEKNFLDKNFLKKCPKIRKF